MTISIKNIMDVESEVMRSEVFKMIEVHVDLMDLDMEKYTYLLGYYPAIYNYLSEMYTFMITKVREKMELNDRYETALARDKRDILDQALKSLKLQYDSLSRKITLLTPMKEAI